MLRAFLLVGLGGGLGSIARYALSLFINRLGTHSFPLATFTINMTGCFLIGLLFGMGSKVVWAQGDGWLVLATAFCGGFTTFSAFALENVGLFNKQLSVTALLYTLLSVLGGILLCRLGIWLTA
ncbi:MAG TPA: fluoride efflux transporter CrcB [Flavipsychrobacter sp.]|nr:fluoride efflux transporter CrcB [Flavipsychrobacter sp.]